MKGKTKQELLKVFKFLIEGLVKVWHKNHSFVISAKDAEELTIEQLENLVSAKESGTLKEVHPLNESL